MKTKLRPWIVVFAVAFAASVVVERVLERMHRVDSLGTWYTIYCAFVAAAVITTGLAAVWALTRLAGRLFR